MEPSTRQFWITAASVCGIYGLIVGRTVSRSLTAGDMGLAFGEGIAFGLPLVLGLTIAWLTLGKDRKERENRSSPLNLP